MKVRFHFLVTSGYICRLLSQSKMSKKNLISIPIHPSKTYHLEIKHPHGTL